LHSTSSVRVWVLWRVLALCFTFGGFGAGEIC
jgi:hypothetical protein